jgi:hypothetical protein
LSELSRERERKREERGWRGFDKMGDDLAYKVFVEPIDLLAALGGGEGGDLDVVVEGGAQRRAHVRVVGNLAGEDVARGLEHRLDIDELPVLRRVHELGGQRLWIRFRVGRRVREN